MDYQLLGREGRCHDCSAPPLYDLAWVDEDGLWRVLLCAVHVASWRENVPPDLVDSYTVRSLPLVSEP